MKARRLLALVLCFVMLFSDATSTLASTGSGEPIVITDSSELQNLEVIDTEEPEADVTSTEETGEEAVATEATEAVVPEEPDKPVEEPEIATEVAEDTEEIVIEVVEDIKATSITSLTVGYTDENDEWVEIGTNPYTSFTDALTGINTFLADPFNGAFSKAVQINMEADATLDCELDLGSDDVPLNLNMNGYTLSVTENRIIRANVWTPNEQSAGTIAVGAGLTLSIKAFDPLGYGMSDDEDWEIEQGQTDIEHTNWQNVVINFDSTNKGDLIIGQEENNGESTTANIRLNDVYINHAKNVTIEGNVGIEGIEVDPSDIQFDVAETINVNNKGDDAYVNHYVEILVPTTCQNLVWYTNGTVADLTVSDTVTADIQSDLNVNGQFTVNDIYVEEYGDDPWGYFGMATHHLYQADGTLISAGTITINGQVTCDEALHVPLNFRKHKWAYASDTAEEPDHLGVFAYTEGEVVATAPNLNRQLVSLSDAETGIRLFADRNEQGQLIAEKPVVEVTYWNDDTNEFEKYLSYTSLEDAVAGMKTEFGEAAGQYIINIYDDIKLNEDIELPDFATYVRVEPLYRHIDVYDEEDNYDYTYYETTFVNVDFNGHSISVNGSVEWSEAIAMTNSADTEAQLYFRGDDTALEIRIEFNEPGETYAYVNAAGETIARPESEYTWIEGVDINIPNGTLFLDMYDSAEFVPSDDITRILDTDITAERVDIQSGTWKITNLSLAENEYGSRVEKDAILTVTGTLTAVGGDSFEIRGALLVADIVVMPNSQDAYANFRFIVEKEYGPENPDQLSYMGDLIFTGNVTGGEGLLGTPVGIGKTNVILSYELDEEGNIMYEDEEQQRPYLSETYQWEDEVSYENGEVLATIAEGSALDESVFVVNREGISLLVEDGKVKIGEAPAPEDFNVTVDFYIEDEDRNIHRGYASIEEAFANMEADFDSRQGSYNITVWDDVTLTNDITVPEFVEYIRFESAREWIEHRDENDELIWIYDEEGNQIGVEGHDRITAMTLDMNGHSITANCDMEWSEVLQIKNSSDNASEIYITKEANPGPDGYWPSFKGSWYGQGELVDIEGNSFDVGERYTFIDNVTIRVPNGRVEFDTVLGGTHVVNGELIVSAFKGFGGKWELADVTIVGSTDGSFVGENAEITITGKTTWLGGAGVEVRGTLTLGDILINANEEDPYANLWMEIVEIFDRDAEGTDDYFVGKGKLTFAGFIGTAENFKADKAVHISKKEVYYYQARDEQGNPLFHDPDGNDPMIWEDQYWDITFESGETVAYVTDAGVEESLFGTNDNAISFEIVGQELKAYKSAVYVEHYIPEEDRGIGFGYKTLEEALDNIERDFEGREGDYTFIILEDTEVSEDIVLPDFVKNLRLQSKWIWYEHRDEYGNPIEIYDEEGNFMGTEGHHDVYEATLDLKGHSITSTGRMEVMEGLHVISDTAAKGELISTSQDGGVSIRQADNVGMLISATGGAIEVSMDEPFVILDSVDIVAEDAGVELWSRWGAYTVNGDITAKFISVRGIWNVKDVNVTTDLCIESGWYDEESDYGEPDGYLIADNVSIFNGHLNNNGRLVVKDTFTAEHSGIENFGTLIADKLLVPSGEFHNYEQAAVKDAEIEWFYNHTDVMYFEDDSETPDVNEEHVEEWGAVFICDTFKQSAEGHSYMDGSSEFIVNVDAVMNDLCTGGFNAEANNPANITRMPEATLQINKDIYPGDERNIPVCIGIFNKLNDEVAGMGIAEVFDRDPETGTIYGSWFELVFVDANGEKAHEIGENGWYGYKGKLELEEVLFTTNILRVRCELVGISQYVEEGKEDEAIWETSQKGDKVVVGANNNTISVYSIPDEDMQWLGSFEDWTEAVAYIDSLENPDMVYAINLTENIHVEGPLALPKNVAEFVILGEGEQQIELTCTGDISLSSWVNFDNIKLNAPNSTVNMNGFNLVVVNGYANIGTVEGTGESILAAFTNSGIIVRKAATGLAGLEAMWGSRIELGVDNTADASMTKKLQLCSSILVIHDSLTVEEVASWDDLNTVVVKDGNSFTITGTVYGPDVTFDEFYQQYVGETGVAADGRLVEKESELARANIYISAIDIVKFDQNSNFADGDVLVIAPNVSPAWFVTGSICEEHIVNEETGESITVRTGIGSLTYKDGDAVCYGEKAAVRVHLYIPEEDRGIECGYESLEDAFANMQADFGGREGDYNITILENTTLTEDIVVPDFVKYIRFETPWEWVEHFDENGEPIWIYDEAGNEIGIEGHDRITALTLDMNGHSITANCDMEWSELLQIINDSDKASEIYITAEANPGPDGYWPSFRTAWLDENAELVYSDNSKFDFGAEHTWIDNVTIRVPNGSVEFETWDADGIHIINGELIVSSFKGIDGKWIVADVTIVGSTNGSFIREGAEVTITGQSTWLGGAGAEVRGTLTFGDININANDEDPYANMWVEIVEVYDRDKEDTDEYFIGKGKVTFAGAVETAENFKADKAVHISKKEVYYYQARDEHGNLLFHDEAQTDPMIWEDQYWDLPFESGETVAYVTDSGVNANLFGTNVRDISFEIVEQELKAYKSAVFVDLYIEEEDRGFGFGYKTLEEALDNMERDFEGREGSYTFNILEDVVLLEDIVLPDFVRNLRLQSEWMWIEHRDEEGNVIEIYDEEGNFMGTEGHHDVYVSTLDMNGHSITAAGHIEVMEGLQVVSNAVNKGAVVKGELVSTTENGGVSIRQIDNGGLIEESGEPIEVSMDKPFVILDNVDVVAEKAHVDLWSLWGAYVANGDITTRFMNVRGTWTVEDVMVTTDLYLESGWYDEENDCGEPDGYLTADNVSIYGGHMYNGGRLVVKDTFTAKNSHIENYGTLIADKLMVPSGEFHNFEQVSVGDAEIEWFYNHTDVMHFEDDPATPDENEEHVEEWGSIFICDTFKQSDKASSYMDGSSEFIVNVEAVINDLCTGGFNEEAMNPANITRMTGANLQINEDIYPGDERNIPVCIGIFDKPNDKVAGMGIVEVFDKDSETGTIYGSWFETAFVEANGEKAHEFGENGWYGYKRKLERDEVLFTTDIKNVRTELVGISQYVEEGKEDEAIWETSQDGNKVVAGGYTIFVYSMADGNWQWLRDFKDWTEAVAYIDSLANPNIGYAIELTEDIKLDGPLTLPKNAAELVIRGLGDKQIELTCTGDISLSSLVAVTNIKLNASNSTVKLNGFNLIFDEGSIAYIGKAVGTKESILAAFNNSAIMIGKAVTGLAGLEVMWGSRIELGMDNTADASAAKKLQLYSSILVLHDSLTVEEVASWDDLNTVAVKDGASFTITGTVYGPDVTWDEACRQYVGDKEVGMDNTFAITENNPVKAKIRISAINIEKFGRNSNLADGDVLVNAPNVSAAWFVTGSIYEDSIINEETGESIKVRTKIGSLTHKNGDTICYGEGDTTPKAVELRIRDDAMGDFIPYDTYATLAEAFATIDSIGNAEGFYRIVLMDDVEIATMTTPSKAQAVQIWVESEQPKTITYGGDMKLNCRLIIANAILAPQSENSKIFVGNYVINLLYGTKLADGCKITGITGSGVAKGSEVNLHDNEITISGDIKNVGVLCLQNSVLKVEGTVNVGDVISFEDDGIPEERRLQPTLIGTAKVTRKDGKVTKVEPKITFAGDTWYEQNVIHIALQEKQADGSYKLLDFTAAEMADVLAAGIPLAKAPKISSMMLLASKENKAAGCITAKDNGYVVARKDVNAVGVTLTFEYPFVRMEWNEEIGDYDYFDDVKIIETYCETVADAATEINNLNTARDYQMRLLPQMTNISSKAPAELKMPNAKAIASLIIMSESAKVDLYYTGKLNFTSDVALINVNFVQTAKDGTAYAQTDTPSPVAISAGGKEMVLANVTFNTPIKLDGKKGKLYIFGPVVTFTNQASDRAYGSILGDVNGDGTPDLTRVCGSITNFTTVDAASDFVLDEYKSGSGYTAPILDVTALNIASHTVFEMYSYDVKAKATVTELVAANGEFSVEGSATIKKSELSGEAWVGVNEKLTLTDVALYDSPMVLSQGDLIISGTVTSETADAILASFRKSADNQTPGLNIKGKVNLTAPENKIGILVYEYNGSGIPTLTGAPNASGMLLSAKNATPDMFKAGILPYDENTALDNVGGKGAYAANNINGYVLAKNGSNIYVYYGNEINVELSDAEGNALGYYSSIADATKAIDALKDKNASYTLKLMNRYGDADTPAELKLPKQANSLTIQKNNGKMHIKGNVALSASTALVVASEAEFAGDVTGKGTFAIGGGVTVTAKDKFDANNLVLNGGSVLEGEKVVTIGTIANNGSAQNKIIYGKDAKNVTYLTIKGWVDGANTNAVLLQLMSDTDKAFHEVTDAVVNSAKLDNVLKLATIEKAALSSFEVMINEETFLVPNGESVTRQIVKANKGIYVVLGSLEANKNGTWLEFEKEGKTYRTYCLDFNQAVNEINNLADKTVDYTINFGRMSQSISDVNLLDKKVTSSITMPKANVANSVTVAYTGGNGQQGIEFTGNISYAGNLGFVNCEIEAAKISKVKTLTLDNTAFVTTGAVSVNNVVIKGGTTWDAFGKTTIGGLDATEKSVSSYLASKPDKNGVPTFTVNGDVPAETFWKVIKAKATADTAVANRYEETYKDRSLVVAKTAGADRFTAYPFADSEPGNNENITNVVAYKDTKNAVKNGNGDDMKVLLSYGGGVTYTKSFEEAVRLIESIGDKNGCYEIQFLTGGDITTTGVAGSYGKLTLPKKAAGVTISGHLAENGKPATTLQYTGTMKTTVGLIFENIVLTEGKVSGGTFTPSYAVTPVTSGKNTEINFMDTVSTLKKNNTQTADLVFTSVSGNGNIVIHGENVEVAGSVTANLFDMNNAGTVSVEKDVKVTEMLIADNAAIEAKGKFTAKTVRVLDKVTDEELSAVIDADGVIALTDIYGEDYDDGLRIVTNRTAANESQLTINGQISGTGVEVAMNVLDSATGKYREMTVADAAALLVTEENAVPAKTQKIATAPKASTNVYVATYEQVDEAGNKDWVYFGELPSENPDEEPVWITTYKHDGGMYLTNLPTLLWVESYTQEGEFLYASTFMNWDQAVKEIDKIGNKNAYYEICLERSVGQNLDGTLNPIKNLTLPSKAAGVAVYGANIYFTGTKITPKTVTEISDVGLYAVKAVKEDGMTMYESVTYDVNIGNNMVAFGNIYGWSDGYESKPGTISGSKKGYLAFYNDMESGANETVANMIKGVGTVEFMNFNGDDETTWASYVVTKGISGVQNLVLQPYTFLGAYEGDISVKDVYADRADMYAKNITVSGTIEMSDTGLSAGTEKIGDGAIKLKDVVLNGKCGIYGKQDKNGKSLIQITGKVSTGVEYEGETEGLLQVGLFYNNDSGWVPLSNKLVLLTAPKADASWFIPNYSWEEYEQAVDEETGEPLWDEDGNPVFVQARDEETGELLFDEYGNPIYVVTAVMERMGWERYGYGVYKLGKTIYYGKLAE